LFKNIFNIIVAVPKIALIVGFHTCQSVSILFFLFLLSQNTGLSTLLLSVLHKFNPAKVPFWKVNGRLMRPARVVDSAFIQKDISINTARF